MPNDNYLSSRQMARLLKKLCIHENDIILLKRSQYSEDKAFDIIRRAIERTELSSVYVILVNDFDEIKTMNTQEMNAHGWYHVSQINKLTKLSSQK